MSNKNFKDASSEAQSNLYPQCSQFGCYRTLQGWTPKQTEQTEEEHPQSESTHEDEGETYE